MSKNFLVTWLVTMISVIAWNLFSYPLSAWLYSVLTGIGIPRLLVHIILAVLPLFLLLEVVVKLLILQRALSITKFIPTQPESWPHLDQEDLARHTSELEQLGFVYLTDYTIPFTQVMARLFAHPRKFCFAEVGQFKDQPMFCSIVSLLEHRWSLGVNNMFVDRNQSAITRAFIKLPRSLSKRFDNASVNVLLQSLLDWREQVSHELNLAVVQDVSAEIYFEEERNEQIERKRSLLCKSISWALLKMIWFAFNPKSEWLGDYSKFQVKHSA